MTVSDNLGFVESKSEIKFLTKINVYIYPKLDLFQYVTVSDNLGLVRPKVVKLLS